MTKDGQEFLRKLVETPSPSGFEQSGQKLIRARMKDAVKEIRTDVHGNVTGVINPDASVRVMIAGHCDEIGLMITHIDEKGYLYVAAIGGVDPVVLPGQEVEILADKGSVTGVIGRKPIHLMKPDERSKPTVKIEDCWIDIGAKDRNDAQKVVAVGNPIIIPRKMLTLRNGLVAARAFDDRAGAWVVVETMRRLKRARLDCAVHGVATVQEEIGLRGARTSAFGIDPHVGIAVDLGFASDWPGAEKKRIGDCSLGKGPILHRGPNINPKLAALMEKVAKEKRIPFQMQAEPRATGTDANMMQIARAGAATSLITIPSRYIHTPVEVIALKDLDAAVKLMAATIEAIKPSTRFTP